MTADAELSHTFPVGTRVVWWREREDQFTGEVIGHHVNLAGSRYVIVAYDEPRQGQCAGLHSVYDVKPDWSVLQAVCDKVSVETMSVFIDRLLELPVDVQIRAMRRVYQRDIASKARGEPVIADTPAFHRWLWEGVMAGETL